MILPILALLASPVVAQTTPDVVEFNRDIRPILSDNCFACHGPDDGQRKAKLRFDVEESAFADRNGVRPFVPGKPGESEVLRRLVAEDKTRMPPAKFGKQLTPEQIALVKKWIEQGAKWQKHWSLLPPQRTAPPVTTKTLGIANPVDGFVVAGLSKSGLSLSPEADRRTLLRRLSFDLRGLPPTLAELEAFEADKTPDAYERLVDRLLASPQFGERLALYWLDLVRYADTGGYHSDNHREIALYRDYVIAAFNSNKPFDVFTREQLAGDLLPNATTEQKIASGYNRLLMTTEEGGAQPKEYTAKYAADRVRNASTVWLASTLGCAECHNHKFDPFTTKDFYRFAAFFADVKEKAVGRQDQELLPTPEQAAQLQMLDQQMAPLQKKLAAQTPELTAAQEKWEESLKKAGTKGLLKPVIDALAVEAEKRTAQQKQAIAAHYRTIAPALEMERKEFAELQKRKQELQARIPTTLVTTSVEPRPMRVLPRGNWLDDSGELVSAGPPEALPLVAVRSTRQTRLDLVDWLMASDNPLTARVFVNRLWKLYFGQGLVKTLDDFGAQGAWPTHPELLDWLAIEFRTSGWNVKHMIRLMVLSRTYRQVSTASEALRQRDPYNLLLARQASFRLDAELVRDNALAVSGLLVSQVGGASVKPYQPAGYWALLNFPRREWQNDKGESLYRRGLYTYWCRTFPHPSLVAFDAPSREECTVERPRSNTPLQALVLLNDPVYVEASRTFAERIAHGGKTTADRLQWAFGQALCRPAKPAELELLTGLYDRHLQQYRSDKGAAEALLAVGERPAAKDVEPAELAAWTSVARVILNLHETITRN